MIHTARLHLRRARPDDAQAMHDIFTREDAMRYWSTPPHETYDQTERWVEGMVNASPDTSDDFIVVHEGRVIGKCGAWSLPEVGFIFHPDHWGQGFAREALEAVIAHLFRTHDLDTLTADVDPRNAASIRLLTKLGFVETHRAERTLKWRDEWCDSVYFALSRATATGAAARS